MKAAPEFTLFETAIGQTGALWGERGILRLQLPEADAVRAKARLLRRFPDAIEAVPPPDIAEAIGAIRALLAGRPADLSAVQLDMARVRAFERQVYEIARTIPCGQTLTYGEVATRIGDKALAQAVGQAMGRNPFPIVVPCHRVVAADGKPGGFSAAGGVQTKLASSRSNARPRLAKAIFSTWRPLRRPPSSLSRTAPRPARARPAGSPRRWARAASRAWS